MPKKTTEKAKKTVTKKSVARSNKTNKIPKGLLSDKGYTLVDKQKIKDNFAETLKQTMNLVTLACEKAGICRTTYYKWREDDPKFAQDCDEVPERIFDLVESELYKKISKGDGESIRFYCKTKMRQRGYVTTTEHTGLNGGAISFANKNDELKRLSKFTNEQLKTYIEFKTILESDDNDSAIDASS